MLCVFTSEPLNTPVRFLSCEVFDYEKLFDQAELLITAKLITVYFWNVQMTQHHIGKFWVITGKTSLFMVQLNFLPA